MNKKRMNDLLLLLYPLLLLCGVWGHWRLMKVAARTYQIPFLQVTMLELSFFLLLGLFAYCFLVKSIDCHVTIILAGAAELLVFTFPKVLAWISADLYAALSGNYFVFATVLTIYAALLGKHVHKGRKAGSVR